MRVKRRLPTRGVTPAGLENLESGANGLQRIVELAQAHLELSVVLVAEVLPEGAVCRAIAGDGSRLGAVPGKRLAIRVQTLPGVALRLSDGAPYGRLCCLPTPPERILGEREMATLSMLAELMSRSLDGMREADDVRRALLHLVETQTVDVAYQPIYELRTMRCLGVEALARFPEPFARPDLTFAQAERVGLGLELEELVVRRAWPVLDQLAPGQFLALNLTPSSLLALARRANHRPEVDLSALVVEVTEHRAIDAYADIRRELQQLRERGLRIAVDDAGAGYASMRHVLELRPDLVKIDRWLVDGLSRDCARRAAVSSFVTLARDLGSVVVAEGVEQQSDLDAIADLGLDAAQGYLLGRPSTQPQALMNWIVQATQPVVHRLAA